MSSAILVVQIVIDAPSHFLSEPARLDVFDEQRAWPVLLAKRFMEEIENTQARIEADEIDHLEWTHRMIQSKLECLIDISGAGDTLLQHEECFIADNCVDS